MGSVVMVVGGVVAIVAVALTVLVRRERRRMGTSLEAGRIEAAATRGIRDARRQAHAHQHFNDTFGMSALRDRDAHG